MMTKKSALAEARRLVAALDGPLGPRPMQRIVSQFNPFFQRLRKDGASWAQIAILLASAGLRSRSGQRITADILRAMVSRSMRGRPASYGAKIDGRAKSRVVSDVPSSGAPASEKQNLGSSDRPAPRLRSGVRAKSANVAERIRRAAQLRG